MGSMTNRIIHLIVALRRQLPPPLSLPVAGGRRRLPSRAASTPVVTWIEPVVNLPQPAALRALGARCAAHDCTGREGRASRARRLAAAVGRSGEGAAACPLGCPNAAWLPLTMAAVGALTVVGVGTVLRLATD